MERLEAVVQNGKCQKGTAFSLMLDQGLEMNTVQIKDTRKGKDGKQPMLNYWQIQQVAMDSL